jgi:DNA-binding NarL/FixJ family response regulator
LAGVESGKREIDYRVIRAQEDERKRLARDLHDGLVQSLVGLGLNLELAERHVEAEPVRRSDALALFGKVREGLAGCLEETRRILSDLRPLDLGERGLAQALKDYAERVSAEAGLRITVVISGQDLRLHPSLEAGIFRVFQEILNNVREHAEAREASVKLRFLPRSVAMDVADDGRGFAWNGDFQELAGRRCFGLLGINERVKLLGGTWRLSSHPGGGTEARIRVPVETRSGFWSFLPHLGSARVPDGERAGREAVRGRSREGQAGARPGGVRSDPALRIVVADDHRVVREGLRMILDEVPDLEVVGEAQDGDEAIALCRELGPDVVLLDLVMPGPGAVEVVRRIREISPRTTIVALTAHHQPHQVRELFAAGVAGYLLKTADAGEIAGAIRASSSGLRSLAPEAVLALAEDRPPEASGLLATAPVSPDALLSGLSRTGEPAELRDLTLREREVLVLVGEGLTNHEIARKLYISDKTVRNHLGAVIRKLGLSDRTQVALAARGLRLGSRGAGH